MMNLCHARILGPAVLLLAAVLSAPARAATITPQVTSQPAVTMGGSAAKAVVDTVTLMGPYGQYPFRGDFETADARPGGEGLLTDGWTTIDNTAPLNRWHVDAYRNPFSGNAAWAGSMEFPSCGGIDPVGGYGNNERHVLEFRKTVAAGPISVRVQGSLQFDTEPGYDFLLLQRRTAASPNFEPVSTGQGLIWDGAGTVNVDYTFTWTAAELLDGTDAVIGFVFDSDGAWSDADCLWGTDGAARLDDLTVTVNGVAYSENFEDGQLGPDWRAVPNQGVGDFARIWQSLGDLDVCASNYSKLLAFVDDGLVVPGTGGTVGQAGLDYGPPGGYVVNPRGGLLGGWNRLENSALSPVMPLPGGGPQGVTVAFDVYRHNLLLNDWAGVFYTWAVRSTAGGEIALAPWKSRNLVYYGGPAYVRHIQVVDDLLVPGATDVQVALKIYQMVTCDFCDPPTISSPAPYFDNVNVKVYPQGGPRIVVTETRLANDGFPASGALDLGNLGANSVRFDMASNISARSHLRIDPGDSIWIDATPRSGGTLSTPVLHWTFAAKNPLFNDAMRTALAPGQVSGSTTGRVTRTPSGTVVANRFNFDLPDTGMLFPGDVLHYYFAASDNVAGDVRTSTAPADLAGFGDPTPRDWPGAYTVNCLPTLLDAAGTQPSLLFWNDAGFRGGEDEWCGALCTSLGLAKGVDFDVYNTHAPSSGLGNGLGGRATPAQVAGYLDLLYTCGDLGTFTLSNGDYSADPGNDLALLDAWLAAGGRDLFLGGDDLCASLDAAGVAGRSFLASRMGVEYGDGDVRDDIGNQVSPLVVRVPGNPVFTTAASWVTYGGCPNPNDFDRITPLGGAARLAQFTAPDGVSTPYGAAAAVVNASGTSRLVTLSHDFAFVIDPAGSSGLKGPAPMPARAVLLSNVLDYFNVPGNPTEPADVPGAAASLRVLAQPNPFNPAVTLRYSLARPGRVVMKVFDARGALVRTLLDQEEAQPSGVATWDGRDQGGGQVSSGLYFVETRADGQVDVRKVTMLK